MRKLKNLRVSWLLVGVLALGVYGIRAAGAPVAPEVAIIVNPANPVTNVSLADLRKLYFGERLYWKTGSPVVLLMRSQGAPERDVILRVVYQMSEERYTQFWVGKVMRAEASDPPASLYSFGIIQEGVKGNTGAIGYLNSRDVRPGVKILRIDGLLPGETGYPLH